MAVALSPIIEMHHESDAGCWDMARGMPQVDLRPWVVGYSGYREASPQTRILRREVPSTVVALIINFGPSFTILDPHPGAHWTQRDTFIAGLHNRPALVESGGESHCLQIDFTPLGACRFFGTGLKDINHLTTPLEDVFGPISAAVTDQLYHATSWQRRFAIVDDLLMARFSQALQPRPAVERAWRLMMQSRGTLSIQQMAQQLNLSREHCSRLIHAELGMSPKDLARIIRFQHATDQLQAGRYSAASIAAGCGYTDQSHFIREIKAMSGCTPAQLAGRYADDGGLLEPAMAGVE